MWKLAEGPRAPNKLQMPWHNNSSNFWWILLRKQRVWRFPNRWRCKRTPRPFIRFVKSASRRCHLMTIDKKCMGLVNFVTLVFIRHLHVGFVCLLRRRLCLCHVQLLPSHLRFHKIQIQITKINEKGLWKEAKKYSQNNGQCKICLNQTCNELWHKTCNNKALVLRKVHFKECCLYPSKLPDSSCHP